MKVFKLIKDDDGNKYPNSYWHYATKYGDSERVFCTGEAIGFGESGVVYKTKEHKKGAINCPLCIEKIKNIKEVIL